MNVPSFLEIPITDKEGRLTDAWRQILQQLLQQLNANFGQVGCVIPTLSSQVTSQYPMGQVAAVAPGAQSGTLVFDTYAQTQNGQLLLRMNDGTFHGITNT